MKLLQISIAEVPEVMPPEGRKAFRINLGLLMQGLLSSESGVNLSGRQYLELDHGAASHDPGILSE
jgi:hypothetical protein